MAPRNVQSVCTSGTSGPVSARAKETDRERSIASVADRCGQKPVVTRKRVVRGIHEDACVRSIVQRQHMDNHLASMAGSAAADVRSVQSVAASVHAEVVTGE